MNVACCRLVAVQLLPSQPGFRIEYIVVAHLKPAYQVKQHNYHHCIPAFASFTPFNLNTS